MKTKNKSALVWILKHMGQQKVSITILVFLYILIAVIGISLSLLAKNLIDSAVNGIWNSIIIFSIGIIFLVLLQIFINIANKILIFNINTKLEINLKTNLYSEILKKNYDSVRNYHSGELMNRIIGDISVVTSTITTLLPYITYLFVKLVSVFSILFVIDYKFALIFFVGGTSLFLLSQIFKKKIKLLHKAVRFKDGKVRSFLQETIESLLVIKVFNAEEKVVDNANSLQQEYFKISKKRNYLSTFATTGFSFIFTIGYFYGMIWGAVNIFNGEITYGTLTAVLSLIAQIQGPINGLTGIIPQYYSAIASVERIMELENLPDEVIVNTNKVDFNYLYKNLKSICFDNITFSYDSEDIFKDTGLSINKGDYVLITGISGIGKSTLTRLLLNVYTVNNGEIYLLLNNDEKIYVDKSLRQMFAYVPQGNFLLSGTIRDNIAFMRPDATDEEIMEVAKICCADEFISNLSNGLDTLIGEKGTGLSEGQVQRIAIARAVICNNPILLLDEATSALDIETEQHLLQNLRNMRDVTCILISHKESAYSVCNKIVRIDDKKILVRDNITDNK